jgi:hypothetical protein
MQAVELIYCLWEHADIWNFSHELSFVTPQPFSHNALPAILILYINHAIAALLILYNNKFQMVVLNHGLPYVIS